MTADDVIAIRKLWSRMNFGASLPSSTVLAERNWLAYVQAMTALVPVSDTIVWPTEEEIAWAWPDGVTIVLDEPLELGHTIIATDTLDADGRPTSTAPVAPHQELQKVAGLAILPTVVAPTIAEDGGSLNRSVAAAPVCWIGHDATDFITGWWMPGVVMAAATGQASVSASSRFLMSVIAALGHRLTKLAEPSGGRGERRRAARELPGLRVLTLASGASVKAQTTSHVEWSHRWMVRGHWRQQPCGPQRSQRRLQWIDPYVKGPDDKPLDVRPTIWRTGDPE